MSTFTISSTSTGVAWNGPACGTCGVPYATGIHKCSPMDLLRRANELRDLALKRFEEMHPQPTTGPEDRMRHCACRPENGGSGICGCVMGGPQVTC